jgi:hypothetical protein
LFYQTKETLRFSKKQSAAITCTKNVIMSAVMKMIAIRFAEINDG